MLDNSKLRKSSTEIRLEVLEAKVKELEAEIKKLKEERENQNLDKERIRVIVRDELAKIIGEEFETAKASFRRKMQTIESRLSN